MYIIHIIIHIYDMHLTEVGITLPLYNYTLQFKFGFDSLCHRSVHLMDVYRVCVCVCASYLGADVFVFQMISFLHSDEYTYSQVYKTIQIQNFEWCLHCMLMDLRYSCTHCGKSIIVAVVTVTCLHVCTQVSIYRHSSNSNFKCQLYKSCIVVVHVVCIIIYIRLSLEALFSVCTS